MKYPANIPDKKESRKYKKYTVTAINNTNLEEVKKVAEHIESLDSNDFELVDLDELREQIEYYKSYLEISVEAMENLLSYIEALPRGYKVIKQISKEDSDIPKVQKGDADLPATIEVKQPDYFIKKRDKIISLEGFASATSVLDFLKVLSSKDVLDFYLFLNEYVMLGLKHKVGRKILSSIKQGELPSIDFRNSRLKLFRARPWKEEQEICYTSNEMFDPPFGYPTQGRFNVHGQPVLYTCTSLEGAIQEVGGCDNQKVDVIEWIFKGEIKVVDLVDFDCDLFAECMRKSRNEHPMVETAYLIPNFFAQCCSHSGIDAIRYKSTKDPNAVNYVFLSYNSSWFHRVNFYPKRFSSNKNIETNMCQEV